MVLHATHLCVVQEHGAWPDDDSENDEAEERPKKLR